MTEGRADQSRELILQAAIQGFALHGYSKASTNSIMKQAGMAKGLLFHHFASKKRLYLACLEGVLNTVQQPLDLFIAEMPADFFKRMAALLQWKLDMALQHPLLFRFMFSLTSIPPEINQEATSILTTWRTSNARLLADYDTSKWNPAIDQKQAIAIIVMLFESIDNKWLQGMKTADQKSQPQSIVSEVEAHDPTRETELRNLLQQALQMLDVLRTGFYR